MLLKRFLEWIQVKKRLDRIEHQPPHISEGDIWWVSIGENIGSEINGKSQLFSRPVIIFKKLTRGFYFVIPTSTKVRDGNWYVNFRQKGREMIACLQQARVIDYRRLSSKLGTLDDEDFSRVREGFKSLYLE